MIPLAHKPDWLSDPDIIRLLEVLGGAGIEGRFVGGCVRDFLAGLPVHDFDIAVNQPPDNVMAALKAAGVKAIPTGIDHGTVTAVMNHRSFELTTLREDVETDGRHAKVAFSDDWQLDASRRDFTMNALYLGREGQLYDYFGGYKDLKAGVVRFVGDPAQRLEEDVLRLLRFFRFAARFQAIEVEDDVRGICQEFAPKLAKLSVERIWQEWKKLLGLDQQYRDSLKRVLQVMSDINLFSYIYPNNPVSINPRYLAALSGFESDSPLVRLSLLHWTESKAQMVKITKALRFSNEEKSFVRDVFQLKEELLPADSFSPDIHFYKSYYRFGVEKVLAFAAISKHVSDPESRGYWQAVAGFARSTGDMQFPLLGRDLLQLGVEAGPLVGQKLKQIEIDWIASGFTMTREECLIQAKQLVS